MPVTCCFDFRSSDSSLPIPEAIDVEVVTDSGKQKPENRVAGNRGQVTVYGLPVPGVSSPVAPLHFAL